MSVDTLYLIDAKDRVDEQILRKWIAEHVEGTPAVMVVPHPRATDGASRMAMIAGRLSRGDDLYLTPMRVAWVPEERDGDRTVRLRDLVTGDPLNPSTWRKERILKGDPSRAVVVTGDGALLSELKALPEAPEDPTALAALVARRAHLALERAEYRVRGARYKVPRLVKEDLTNSVAFRERAEHVADQLGRPREEVWAEVLECLDEMVTGYSRMFLDLMARMGKRSTRGGYGEEFDYVPEQLERVRDVVAKHPAVILPSHKSNLDALVIPVALHENGLPPTHTFAGINMAFWPYGTIFRRAGRIFIRRDIKNDPVYRFVLREYLGYLVEKRFTLEWYIEGTRSRTGKLAPPKMGLLRYIADACREGRTDDVMMVPVSIVYDQLGEVAEYANEARGATKKAESIFWAMRFNKSVRGSYGRIYVRFGEVLSLREAIERDVPRDDDSAEMSEADIRLQKLAFEVCTRINAVTPITASALICMILLATRGRALSAQELHTTLGQVLAQVRTRELPLAASAERLDTEEGVRSIVGSLAANRTIEVYDDGDRPVYMVERDSHLAAAFYRNTIVHHFVDGAIGELALLHAADTASGEDRVKAFWEETYRLRDLLKFDFFFEPRDAFRAEVDEQLRHRVPDWEEQLGADIDPAVLLSKMQPLHAFAVLRPFIEAYLIVAKALASEPLDEKVDRKAFTKRCLALGGQWLRQDRIRSPEAVSSHLFPPAIQLAEHRGLTVPGADLAARRRAFVEELADVDRRIDATEQMAYQISGHSLTEPTW